MGVGNKDGTQVLERQLTTSSASGAAHLWPLNRHPDLSQKMRLIIVGYNCYSWDNMFMLYHTTGTDYEALFQPTGSSKISHSTFSCVIDIPGVYNADVMQWLKFTEGTKVRKILHELQMDLCYRPEGPLDEHHTHTCFQLLEKLDDHENAIKKINRAY